MTEDAIDVDSIPAELRSLNQWVTWRFEERGDGETTKVPYSANGRLARSNDPATWGAFEDVLRAARQREADAGVGFVFAESGGIFGIDLDKVIDHRGELEPFARDFIAGLNSYTEISPRGHGVHIFARGRLPKGRRKLEWLHADGRKLGIEVYEFGRYFTVTGKRFGSAASILEERSAEIAELHARYLSDAACAARKPEKKPGRHEAIVTQTVRLQKAAAAPDEILAKAHALNGSFREPKPDAEVAKIVDWAVDRVEPESTEAIEFRRLVEYGNDAQNAEFFARRASGLLVFNATEKAWLVFDGRRWAKDADGGVMRFAIAAVEEMLRQALEIGHDEFRQKAIKYAVSCESRRKLEAMIEIAKSQLPATSSQFDCDPHLLNVANGTLDLRTGTLRAHDPADRLTKLAPVAFDDTASAPRWERFLSEIFLGRADLIEYVQLFAGYALTGDTSEHVLLIPYGGGANGKSVFLGVLEKLLGDYALHADVTLFLARREHGATPELARLKGVRFVASSEMPEGGRLSENLVKSLTGGDRVAARHLYGEFFEYVPTAKFAIGTNYRPIVRGDDDGIWRRLKLVPFDAQFVGENRDPHLAETLEGELPGILRWAVAGCLKWRAQSGLSDPAPVAKAMAEYRSDSDAIGAFIADRCVVRDGCEVRATSLAGEFKRWSEAGNERTIPARTFRTKIRERGFTERRSNGDVVFGGIGLRYDRETSTS